MAESQETSRGSPKAPPLLAKQPWINMKTPKVGTSFMYLLKPDTKYKADGSYSVTLVLDPTNAEHKAFMDKINGMSQEVFDRRIKNIKREREDYRLKKLFKVEYARLSEEDKAKGLDPQPTGKMTLKVSTSKPFALYGPKATDGQVSKETLKNIWSGSTCKVNILLKEHEDSSKKTLGFVVYFDKIQFIDILKGSGNNSGSNPFSDEEGTTQASPDATGDTPSEDFGSDL